MKIIGIAGSKLNLSLREVDQQTAEDKAIGFCLPFEAFGKRT